MCFLQQAYKERGEGKLLKEDVSSTEKSSSNVPSRLFKRFTNSCPVLSWEFSVWVSWSTNETEGWQLLWKGSAKKDYTGSACQNEEKTNEDIVIGWC